MADIITDRQEELGQWMAERNAHRFIKGYGTYIGLESNGRIIACTGYDQYLVNSIQAHIAIDGRITKQWLWFIFYYPFAQAGVNKIIAPVLSDNIKSIRLCAKMGFILEAVINGAGPKGQDILFMTLVKQQCRFI